MEHSHLYKLPIIISDLWHHRYQLYKYGMSNLILTYFEAGFDFSKIILKETNIYNTYIFCKHENYNSSMPLQRQLLLMIDLIIGISLDVLTFKHNPNISIVTCKNSMAMEF
jgi:hypothetical protein